MDMLIPSCWSQVGWCPPWLPRCGSALRRCSGSTCRRRRGRHPGHCAAGAARNPIVGVFACQHRTAGPLLLGFREHMRAPRSSRRARRLETSTSVRDPVLLWAKFMGGKSVKNLFRSARLSATTRRAPSRTGRRAGDPRRGSRGRCNCWRPRPLRHGRPLPPPWCWSCSTVPRGLRGVPAAVTTHRDPTRAWPGKLRAHGAAARRRTSPPRVSPPAARAARRDGPARDVPSLARSTTLSATVRWALPAAGTPAVSAGARPRRPRRYRAVHGVLRRGCHHAAGWEDHRSARRGRGRNPRMERGCWAAPPDGVLGGGSTPRWSGARMRGDARLQGRGLVVGSS